MRKQPLYLLMAIMNMVGRCRSIVHCMDRNGHVTDGNARAENIILGGIRRKIVQLVLGRVCNSKGRPIGLFLEKQAIGKDSFQTSSGSGWPRRLRSIRRFSILRRCVDMSTSSTVPSSSPHRYHDVEKRMMMVLPVVGARQRLVPP